MISARFVSGRGFNPFWVSRPQVLFDPAGSDQTWSPDANIDFFFETY